MKASSVVRVALQRHGAARRSLGHSRLPPLSQHLFHTVASPSLLRNDEEREQQLRPGSLPCISLYHTTAPVERGAAIVLGLGAISCASFAAAQSVKAYREWKESQPETPIEEEEPSQEETTQQQQQEEEGPRENVFKKWFDAGVGSKYYEGGFEEEMTRREAALILGVRESSTPKRIKEAHRKLLILNHPDTGGSTYMSGKINEAKELLLKGKKDK